MHGLQGEDVCGELYFKACASGIKLCFALDNVHVIDSPLPASWCDIHEFRTIASRLDSVTCTCKVHDAL